jgi:ribonuclease R
VRVIGGARDRMVGILERGHGAAEVTPYRDDARWRVFVPEKQLAGAKSGEVVVVEILPAARGRGRAASPRSAPAGRVVERIGRPGEPEADFRAVAWHRRLPVEFPAGVLAEIEGLPSEIPPRAVAGRLDLRDRDFVTIDPVTARDHDDAVFVERDPKGGDVLWVAIADVAHYVRPGTALDREAERRGNSVYFPDRAIPMLPERLSTDLCSLRPDEDRLAMVVKLHVDASGGTHRPEFHEAVIRSRAKLSYADAWSVLEHGTEHALDAPIAEQVERLGRVAERLRHRREAEGSLDFELPEPVVDLDERGRVKDIRRFERNEAHRAIEDAMLAANRAVARFLTGEGRATLHRVHEPPDEEDVDALAELFLRVGLLDELPAHVDTRTLQRVLDEARGHREERLVHMLTLRAMKQARYSEAPLGHFALAFDDYLHFTSPIRRYADLVVHRTLKARLAHRPSEAGEALPYLAVRLSALERRAVAAEREMLDLKKAALMAGHLGEDFEGIVTGAGEQGVYVTLDHPFVEGLLPARNLPQACRFDLATHGWISHKGGPRFRLGDRLEVRVVSVDQLRGWVNFGLVEEAGSDARSGRDAKVRPERPRGRRARPKAAPSRGRDPRRRSRSPAAPPAPR